MTFMRDMSKKEKNIEKIKMICLKLLRRNSKEKNRKKEKNLIATQYYTY